MNTINGLQLQQIESCAEPEPTYYMQQQSLAKVLSPARYQHGLSRSKLFDYTYAAGDLIVCNRGIDEFVRWGSEINSKRSIFLSITHNSERVSVRFGLKSVTINLGAVLMDFLHGASG